MKRVVGSRYAAGRCRATRCSTTSPAAASAADRQRPRREEGHRLGRASAPPRDERVRGRLVGSSRARSARQPHGSRVCIVIEPAPKRRRVGAARPSPSRVRRIVGSSGSTASSASAGGSSSSRRTRCTMTTSPPAAMRSRAAASSSSASPRRSVMIDDARGARTSRTSGASADEPAGVVGVERTDHLDDHAASCARRERSVRRTGDGQSHRIALGVRDGREPDGDLARAPPLVDVAAAETPSTPTRRAMISCGSVARSVVSRTYARSLRASSRQSTRRGSSPWRYRRNSLNSAELPRSRDRCAPMVATGARAAAGQRTPRTASSSAPYVGHAGGHRQIGQSAPRRRDAFAAVVDHLLGVTPSASAAKFASTRWRSTGSATRRMSSGATVARPARKRVRLGAEDQRLTGARARAPAHGALHERASPSRRPAASRARATPHSAAPARSPRRRARHAAARQPPRRRAPGASASCARAGRRAEDRDLVVRRRIADAHVEQEAIELRFGQRIRALLLDRVLRREHEERLGQRACVSPAAVTRCSCIASSSAACVRGGARLISSARTMLAKIGPRTKRKLRAPGRRVLLEDLGAGDVARHEVRRELDAPEVEAQRLGDRADHQRLRESRHADEQRVSARGERHEDFVERRLLPDDALAALRRAGAAARRAARPASARAPCEARRTRTRRRCSADGTPAAVREQEDRPVHRADVGERRALVEHLPAAQLEHEVLVQLAAGIRAPRARAA